MQRFFSLVAMALWLTGALQLGGLPYWAGQCVAWADMWQTNLKSHGVWEATRLTLDGRHPCSLCLKIQKAQKSQPPPVLSVDKKAIVRQDAPQKWTGPTTKFEIIGLPLPQDPWIPVLKPPPRADEHA